MRKRMICVKIATDEAFQKSYWSYDIQKELRKVFREFRRQFGIGFKVTKVEEWTSIGSPDLRDFPLNVIRRLTKVGSEEQLIEKLVGEIEQLEIPWEIFQKRKERLCRALRRRSKTYQRGYLTGFLGARLQRCLLKSLIEKVTKGEENTIVLGFTGKIIFPEHYAVLGSASEKDGYALIGISESPSYMILHELGHLFGAKHTKDESTVSVMKQYCIGLTYKFDEKNKEIIRDRLKKYQ